MTTLESLCEAQYKINQAIGHLLDIRESGDPTYRREVLDIIRELERVRAQFPIL